MGVVDVSLGVHYLQEHGYPVFSFPENAAKALGALYKFNSWLNREIYEDIKIEFDKNKVDEIIHKNISEGNLKLGELECKEIFSAYGFNTLPMKLAHTADEAATIAKEIGYPVVMKIVSPDILHQSDAKGVIINLQSEDEVKNGFEKIIANAKAFKSDAHIKGILVQKMAQKGVECIVGATRYPRFGPLIMFGFGGIFVEVLKDVSFRVAPISEGDARRMVEGIKAYKLLTGFRGDTPKDIYSVEKLLMATSHLMVNHPEIQEMDINPLLVHDEGMGCTVADCRIILKKD